MQERTTILLKILEQDEKALETENSVDLDQNKVRLSYLKRMASVLNGEEVEPITIKLRRRCDAIPYGMHCRQDRGHVMPHRIDEGPWPEEKWSKSKT